MALRPNQVVTSTTPPAIEILSKTVQVKRTDTTAFSAFVLPKGVVIAGAYVLGPVTSDAGTSAIIDVGTNPGTANEVLTAYSVLSTAGTGYNAAGAYGGSAMGTQLTADTLYKANYAATGAETTGGPWLVKVEYYIPQQGYSF